MSALFPLSAVAEQWNLAADHKEPERWIATQIKRGKFRGRKCGRQWRMRADDIAHAEEVMATTKSAPEVPVSLESRRGLSAASLRRRSA